VVVVVPENKVKQVDPHNLVMVEMDIKIIF
jgi:hypothetical protein